MRRNSKNGFAILTVVFVMVVFAVLGTAVVSYVTTAGNEMMDEYQSEQAFAVGEAGLQYTAEELQNDTDWSGNTGTTKSFGPGSFTTSYLAQTVNTATVRSVGTVGGISRTMQQDFSSGYPKAFSKGIYVNRNIDVNAGATGHVYGDVTAGQNINETAGVTFHNTIEENSPTASVPTPNWAYLQSIATNVISGNYTFASGTYTGRYYITGNATIRSNVTINGSIFTRGNVNSSNRSNITITATAPYPAVVAQNGATFNSVPNLNITGWIHGTTSVAFTNGATITLNGGISSGQDVLFSGGTSTVSLTYNPAYMPSAAMFTGGEGGGLTLTNWKETF